MFKLMDKKIIAILLLNFLRNRSFDCVPYIIFTYVLFISGQVPLLFTSFGDSLINIQRIDMMDL